MKEGNLHLLSSYLNQHSIDPFKNYIKKISYNFENLYKNYCIQASQDLRSLVCVAKPVSVLSFGGKISFDIGSYLLKKMQHPICDIPNIFFISFEAITLSQTCKKYVAEHISQTMNYILNDLFDKARSAL